MRRFTSLEVGMLVLAGCLFAVGLVWVVHPIEATWIHPTTDAASQMPGTYIESVSQSGARVYGAVGVLVGGGLAAWVLLSKCGQ